VTLTIEVPGIPQPGGSKRAFKRGERIIVTDDNPKARPWKDRVIAEARLVLGARPALDGPLHLSIEFRMPRPKGHYGKKGLRASAPRYPTTRPDSSKLARCTEDSLTEAGVWRDDAQVVIQVVEKRYDEKPGATIRVSAIEE